MGHREVDLKSAMVVAQGLFAEVMRSTSPSGDVGRTGRARGVGVR